MATKLIDWLLFAQGGHCFFCQRVLGPGEASVEHLVASSNGGNSDPNNCVVCCQTLNALLGNMSLKEKLKVLLNQQGRFQCPSDKVPAPALPVPKLPVPKLPVPKLPVPKLPVSKLPVPKSPASKPSVPKLSVPKSPAPKLPALKPLSSSAPDAKLAKVVADLRRRGVSLPSTVNALSSTIRALFQKKIPESEVASLLKKLKAKGIISVTDTKVKYKIPPIDV